MAVALRKPQGEGKISAIFQLIMRDSATKGACRIRRECNDGPTRSRISWRSQIRSDPKRGDSETVITTIDSDKKKETNSR